MSRRRREVLISDLSICGPKSALSARYAPGKWKLLPYEQGSFSGRMLAAVGSRNAAPLTLPLRLRGWYAIHLGVYSTYEIVGLRVKLTSDPSYRKFIIPRATDTSKLLAVVKEHFWKAADLTGQSIHIAPVAITAEDVDNYLAYVRLVPLTAAQVKAVRRERARADTKRLFAMDDGTDMIASFHIADRRGLAEEIDVYRDNDFAGISQELIKGDVPIWPVAGYKQRRFRNASAIPIRLYEEVRRLHKRMDADGFNLLAALRDLTREAGLKLMVSHRMGHASQPPYEEMMPCNFVKGDYRDYCRMADGTPVPRLSYAKRHVQDRILPLFKDAASYGVDGFHLLFIRGGPVVMYEEEMIERFRSEYGSKEDPRKLPLTHPRLLRLRGQIFGEYLRRLRETINSSARKAGFTPPIISVHGLSDAKACALFGMDLAEWAREGLIDRIVATCWGSEFGAARSEKVWPYMDAGFYRRCVAGTKVELFAEVPAARHNFSAHYRRWAEYLYGHGVQGLYFWDTHTRRIPPDHFAALSVLGHRKELRRALARADGQAREVPMRRLLGMELAKERFPAWLSG